MMPASRTPSIRLPPDELNRIPDTGLPELADVLMMSLSRFASPSASSPFRRTIVLFSFEIVVVRSAADADAAAAATNTNANTLLDIAGRPASHPSAQFDQLHPLVGADNHSHIISPKTARSRRGVGQRLTVIIKVAIALGYAPRGETIVAADKR